MGHDPTMPTAGVVNKAKAETGAGDLDPEVVIANRNGDVLIKHTVLKADHFPSKLVCPSGSGSRGLYRQGANAQNMRIHSQHCHDINALCAGPLSHAQHSTHLSRFARSCSHCVAGCHNTKLQPILEGAPNFRKAREAGSWSLEYGALHALGTMHADILSMCGMLTGTAMWCS